MSDLNDLEIIIKHSVEGGADLKQTISDVQKLGDKAQEASGKVDKLNQSNKSSGSSGSSKSDLDAEIESLQKKIRLFEQQMSLLARTRVEQAHLRSEYKEENLKAEGDDAARIRAIGQETAARIRQSEVEKEATRQQIALERELAKIRSQAGFFSGGASRGAAGRLAGLESMGASKAQIEEAAGAFKKLESAASAATIPLFQLSPVIGYQAAMMARLATSVSGVAASLSPFAILAGGTAVAIGGISLAVLVGANNLGNYARQMKNLSEETGLSIEGAQLFSRVTEVMGLRAQAIVPGVQRLYLALAEGGEQSKKSAQAFDLLGVHARDATTGALKPMDDLLPKVFEALKNVKDEATANAIAHALFGRSFNQLIPAIKEYEETARRVKETGVIISPETMQRADEFHQKIAMLKDDWHAFVLALEEKAIGTIEVVGKVNKAATSNPFGAFLNAILSYDSRNYSEETNTITPAAKARMEKKQEALFKVNKEQAANIISSVDSLTGTTPSEGLLKVAREKLSTAREKVEEHGRNQSPTPAVEEKAFRDAGAEVRRLEDRVKGEREYQTLLKENKRLQVEAAQSGLEGLDKMIAKHKEELEQIKKFPDIYRVRAKLFAQDEAGELGKESNAASDVIQKDRMQTAMSAINSRVDALKRLFDLQSRVRDSAAKLEDPSARHDFAGDRSSSLQFFGAQEQGVRDRYQAEADYAGTLQTQKERTKALADAEKHRTEGFVKSAKDHIDAVLKIAAAETEADLAEQGRSADSARKIEGIRSSFDVQAVRRRAGGQISALASNALPGDERHLAQQEYAIRLDAEAKITAERIKQVELERDADKRREESARIRGEAIAEAAQIELQYQERIAAIRKQELDRSRNVAGGLFGALTDTRGPGAGLQTFLRSETLGMEKTMFENLLTPFITQARGSMAKMIPGQRDTHGDLTKLGTLFSGTTFGDKGTDTLVRSTDALSDVNKKLKDTIDSLNQYISGNGGTVTITGAGSNTNVIIPGDGANINSLPNRQVGLPFGIPGLSNNPLSSWMQAALGIGGAAVTTVGGLAAAGLFNGSGFSIAKREPTVPQADGGNNAHNGLVQSSGPGINIPQVALSSLIGLVTGLSALSKVLPADGTNPLSQLTKGLANFAKTGGTGFFGALTGQDYTVQTGPGQYATASSLGLLTPSARAGDILAGGAALAAGGFQAYQGFKQGGARGALSGVSAITGTAAAFDPEPISKGILTAIAVGSSIIGAMLGDPKQKYANLVQKTLENDRYLAPPTLNETVGMGGFDINYSKNGRARQIPFQGLSSSLPFLQKDPYSNNTWLQVPGQVFQPGQAGGPVAMPPVSPGAAYPGFVAAGGGNVTIHLTVHALDTRNILDRSHDIGQAMVQELNKGGALANAVQSKILGS